MIRPEYIPSGYKGMLSRFKYLAHRLLKTFLPNQH